MTFSVCVRERPSTPDGAGTVRYGVAVTTRRPAVGSRCPFVSVDGAIASQSHSNPRIGRKGLAYLADGLDVGDALRALLHADDDASHRQVHGVDDAGTFAYSGEDCSGWYGHREGPNYTVAGNLLTGPEVLDAVTETYEDGDQEAPLPERLVDCLAAGHDAGGDKRDREIQSAACMVRACPPDGEGGHPALVHDLRVDASRSPVADLRTQLELARAGADE